MRSVPGVSAQLGRLKEVAARQRMISRLSPATHDDWVPYLGLNRSSIALAGISPKKANSSVNLLLPALAEESLFAGLRTALVFGAHVANGAGMPLRIMYFGASKSPKVAEHLAEVVSTITGLSVNKIELVSIWGVDATPISDSDIWIATYWSTAHAISVACTMGLLSADQVIYLVQDYEPEFFPGSTVSALARATYHAGFRMVVNSTPLRDYIVRREGLDLDESLVFRPELDLVGLSRAAERRKLPDAVRVTFYGRPSKPRNSFDLGISALTFASALFAAARIPVEFVSIGEHHKTISLRNGELRSLGKLEWSKYFDFLAQTDVLLSLQQTPHPSHPPLDAVASGGMAVTNDFGGTRGGTSPRLLARIDDPRSLAAAILEAGEKAMSVPPVRELDIDFVQKLGKPLADVAQVALRPYV